MSQQAMRQWSPLCLLTWCHSFTCAPWLTTVESRVMSQQAMRLSYDVTHSYTWRDSFTCAPWLITVDPLPHCLLTVNSNKAWVNRQRGNESTVMSHGAHVNESRHVYEHGSDSKGNEAWCTREWVTSRTRMGLVTHMNASCHASLQRASGRAVTSQRSKRQSNSRLHESRTHKVKDILKSPLYSPFT